MVRGSTSGPYKISIQTRTVKRFVIAMDGGSLEWVGGAILKNQEKIFP